MTYHPVCRLAELPEGTARRVEVDGLDVCVAHTQGHVYAIDDTCSHAEVSLSEGDVDGCFIECWLHGSRFDLRTGEPTGPPATEPVASYLVTMQGDGADAVVLVSVDPADEPNRETNGETSAPRQMGRHRWSS